jgi:oligosaccharide repeat unit polymerase
MMESLLSLVISLLAISVALYISRSLLKRPTGPFHIAIILIALALIDVYIPAIFWIVEGIPSGPEWMIDITYPDMLYGLVFYTAFYVLMLIPLLTVKENRGVPAKSNLKRGRLEVLTPTMLFLAVAALLLQVYSFGGPGAWFFRMSLARWTGELDESTAGGLTGLMLLLPWRVMFGLLVIIGFYFRDELRPRYLYTYVYPSAAVVLAMTTFFRGSVLLLTLGLIFAEHARRRNLPTRARTFAPRSKRSVMTRKLVLGISLTVAIFVAFGAVRDHFNLEALETVSETKGMFTLLRQGSGILGISSIVGHYGEKTEDRFLGKTYLDMLLFPVPRSIYTSKPEWYGIDDITRGMGWPTSTQSAVTIPGEAFANFGPVGLLLAPLFGLLLRWLFARTCSSNRLYFFLYPSVILYMIFISNWMSFTGMMNQFLPLICMFLLILLFLQAKTGSSSRWHLSGRMISR